jgi:hypothetical protein
VPSCVAVALGGVDQVHAELPRASEQPVHLRLGEAPPHSPPSCQVPTPITETLAPSCPACGPSSPPPPVRSPASQPPARTASSDTPMACGGDEHSGVVEGRSRDPSLGCTTTPSFPPLRAARPGPLWPRSSLSPSSTVASAASSNVCPVGCLGRIQVVGAPFRGRCAADRRHPVRMGAVVDASRARRRSMT